MEIKQQTRSTFNIIVLRILASYANGNSVSARPFKIVLDTIDSMRLP